VDDAPVRFDDVDLAFGRRRVFRGLTCAFPGGKVSVILGGSGSGKSTMLRLVGGLVRADKGRVLVESEDVGRLDESGRQRVRRRLGMMFQGGALLDSMTVFENLAFPLREHTKLDARGIADAVGARLAAVGLSDAGDLLPGQLSGGMLKRAALARALMMDPVHLLCDEPFSGLDPVSLRRIERLLLEVNRRLGMTMLIVSHHIPSTLRMADQIVLLLPDRMVAGAPEALLAGDDPVVRAFLREEDVDVPDVEVEFSA
jgi:phospholipid/cholesterol/gamma-HCH transport system ATP-binding protein